LADGPRPRQGKGGEGKGEAEGEREEGELEGSRLDTASRDVTRAREALGTGARRGSPAKELKPQGKPPPDAAVGPLRESRGVWESGLERQRREARREERRGEAELVSVID
jgi:hypothetical protein